MTKGTSSMGKRVGIKHIRCRRCGKTSYNLQKGYCAACGYGRSSKIRSFKWQNKNFRRRERIR
ncbi:MAG: 50S ribosomal protein L37e [Candidatus Aenigmatarchaeota archaeon]